MHNRQSSQTYEYDAEFLLKALASLFAVSVSITLIYHRNYLFITGKNYADALKARFFGAKPADTAPPPSVPYQTINASLAPTALGEKDDKQEPSPGSDSETPTNPAPLAEADATTTPEAEVKAADQIEETSPDPADEFVDVDAEYKQGKIEDEKGKEQEPEAISSLRPR